MSVGFSSWTISVGYTAQADLNLTVDRVVDINNYFEFAGEAKYFKYTSEGIAKDDVLNPSSDTLQEGYIYIPFQIKASGAIKDHLPEGTESFKIQTILIDTSTYTDTSVDFLNKTTIESFLAMNEGENDFFVDGNHNNNSISNIVEGKELISTFNFVNNSTNTALANLQLCFQVRYKFSFSTADFKSLYTSAKSSFHFSFKAGVIFDEQI